VPRFHAWFRLITHEHYSVDTTNLKNSTEFTHWKECRKRMFDCFFIQNIFQPIMWWKNNFYQIIRLVRAAKISLFLMPCLSEAPTLSPQPQHNITGIRDMATLFIIKNYFWVSVNFWDILYLNKVWIKKNLRSINILVWFMKKKLFNTFI
jgi:hypothetical protein